MSKSTEDTDSLHCNIMNMRILDALDFLNDHKKIVQQDVRSELLQETVIFFRKFAKKLQQGVELS